MYSYYEQKEEMEQAAIEREDHEADRADEDIKELKLEGYWPLVRVIGINAALAQMLSDKFL